MGVHVIRYGLCLGEIHVDVMAGVTRNLAADAVLETFFAEVGSPGPGDDSRPCRIVGLESHFAIADKNQGADVGMFEPVYFQQFAGGLHQFFGGVIKLDGHDMGGTHEPIHVLAMTENCRAAVFQFISADALEDAHSIVQRMCQHVDVGVAPINELSVEPDFFLLFNHLEIFPL